ncbi:hypothetical protein TNCV_1036631 [Trichonephila clavipes]|nr:hypothetical protein TNCV_1036631 [Trichonephila clavipes]
MTTAVVKAKSQSHHGRVSVVFRIPVRKILIEPLLHEETCPPKIFKPVGLIAQKRKYISLTPLKPPQRPLGVNSTNAETFAGMHPTIPQSFVAIR